MAKVEMARCDQCGKMEEITIAARNIDAVRQPQGWYTLMCHFSQQRDFCSPRCLQHWAHKQQDAEVQPDTNRE